MTLVSYFEYLQHLSRFSNKRVGERQGLFGLGQKWETEKLQIEYGKLQKPYWPIYFADVWNCVSS